MLHSDNMDVKTAFAVLIEFPIFFNTESSFKFFFFFSKVKILAVDADLASEFVYAVKSEGRNTFQ